MFYKVVRIIHELHDYCKINYQRFQQVKNQVCSILILKTIKSQK
nr:MAG TPA: hypothetical protein [Caudoviricetes sp.]